jgi:hypothetical protein
MASKTMLLLTKKLEGKKEVYTSLTSLIAKNENLGLKYRTVYGYTHTANVEYATDKAVIERIPIVHPS